MSDNWKTIGKIKEPHGLRGDLYLLVFSKQDEGLDDLEEIQIGEKIYEIQTLKPYKDGAIIHVKGIDNRNLSEPLKGLTCAVPANFFISSPGETIFLSEILGFEVFDGENRVGVIEGFSSNGPQDLLVVKRTAAEGPAGAGPSVAGSSGAPASVSAATVEIPFVEAFIAEIVFEKKQVRMALPPGLVDLDQVDD